MVSVKELLQNKPLFSVEKASTVQAAAEYMAMNNIGAVPVMDGTRLVGIFSERDVINRVVVKKLSPDATRVGDVMTANLVVATTGETHDDCLVKMKKAKCRHLPVVEGDTLVGFISVRDLLDVEMNEMGNKIDFLTDYMFHIPAGMEKKYER